jgi:hypothetical protein
MPDLPIAGIWAHSTLLSNSPRKSGEPDYYTRSPPFAGQVVRASTCGAFGAFGTVGALRYNSDICGIRRDLDRVHLSGSAPHFGQSPPKREEACVCRTVWCFVVLFLANRTFVPGAPPDRVMIACHPYGTRARVIRHPAFTPGRPVRAGAVFGCAPSIHTLGLVVKCPSGHPGILLSVRSVLSLMSGRCGNIGYLVLRYEMSDLAG